MIKKKANEYTADELENLNVGTDEQEVVLQKSRDDDGWSIWVTDNLWVTKMKGLMRSAPNEYKLTQVVFDKTGRPAGYEWKAPAKFVTLKSKKAERVMTEEQKEAARARMKEIRRKQLEKTRSNLWTTT